MGNVLEGEAFRDDWKESVLFSRIASLPEDKMSTEQLRLLAMAWTRCAWAAKLWKGNTWLGVPIKQWPTDLITFQRIIAMQKPKIIVETGTAHGGSALFFASMLELTGGGRVITVDVSRNEAVQRNLSSHALGIRVDVINGDSKSRETIDRVRQLIADEKNVMVLLDSDHGYEHVRAELNAYKEFIPLGGYLIAGDTICEELSKIPGQEGLKLDNPMRATNEFLAENQGFVRDFSCEMFMVTFAPGGFLKRVR